MTTRSGTEVKRLRAQVLAATSHYDVLGLPPAAAMDQIKAAHRILARAFHPDRCRLDDAHDLMAKVNGAYACLGDAKARKLYDTLSHTARMPTCGRCVGTGRVFKQQGFKMRQVVACPACLGSGRCP